MKKLKTLIYSSKNGATFVELASSRSSDAVKIPYLADFPGTLEFSTSNESSSDIEAAKSSTPDREQFVLLAYSGIPVRLINFYYPVVIDLSGAKFSRSSTPVIADHDTSLRVGHTTKQAVILAGKFRKIDGIDYTGPLVYAKGIRSSDMSVAMGIMADAKNGFPFQVSVGAEIVEAIFLDEDEKLEVNGRTVKGPMIVASKTLMREFTITVLGADSNTSTLVEGVAANHQSLTLDNEENSMKFESWVESLGLTLSELSEDQQNKLRASYDRQVKEGTIVGPNATAVTAALNTPQQIPTAQTVSANQGQLTIQAAAQGARGTDGNAGVVGFDLNNALASLQAGIAQGQIRLNNINRIIASHSNIEKVNFMGKEMSITDFHNQAISDPSITANDVELTMLRAGYSAGPAIHVATPLRDLSVQAASCAILRQMGTVASRTHKVTGEKFGYEHFYDQKTLEASDNKHLRGISLHQLMDMTLSAAGMSFHGQRKSDEFIAACQEALIKLRSAGRLDIQADSGPTTMAVTTVFEDVMHKAMLAAYMQVSTTWQEFCAVKNVSDFRTHNLYRMEINGGYRKVGIDGKLEHGTFSEAKFTHSADTYGKIVGLNRTHLINDDMNAFSSIVTSLGLEAGVSLEELVYVTLLSALATFFPVAGTNNNYVSGADSVIGIAGFKLVTEKFSNQVNDEKAPIGVTPDRVLVGTGQQVLAGQLFRDSQYAISGGPATSVNKEFISNPWVGALRPIVSAYMNNTLIKQRVSKASYGSAIPGQSSTHYIAFGNPDAPQGAAINVSFLNGNRLPIVQQADAAFDVLGLQWRAYHDFGVDLGDPKLAVYSKGAA